MPDERAGRLIASIGPSEPMYLEIEGTTYTLVSPPLMDLVRPLPGGEEMTERELSYASSLRLIWLAMRPNHPDVTEEWVRSVFTADRLAEFGLVVAALRGNPQGEEDSALSPSPVESS